MAFEDVVGGGLDYFPCRYGRSRLLFRGPKRGLQGRYVAVLGGTETYGKFVRDPFPALLQRDLSLPVVNFGCMHAGVGAFFDDDAVLAACDGAIATVLQVMSAQNMSNRLYRVHPRRNDRFLKASGALRALYPRTDFTQFNFTRHLLTSLRRYDAAAFARVDADLRATWVQRMLLLIGRIHGPVVLVWIGDSAPDDPCDFETSRGPLFVNRAMLEALRPDVAAIVEVVTRIEDREDGLADKDFAPMERPAAAEVPGPRVHRAVADALAGVLAPLMKNPPRVDDGGGSCASVRSEPVRPFRSAPAPR